MSTPWRGVLCIASQPRAERDSPHAGAIGPALNMPVVDPSFRMPPLVGARGVMSPLRCDAKRASSEKQPVGQSVSQSVCKLTVAETAGAEQVRQLQQVRQGA